MACPSCPQGHQPCVLCQSSLRTWRNVGGSSGCPSILPAKQMLLSSSQKPLGTTLLLGLHCWRCPHRGWAGLTKGPVPPTRCHDQVCPSGLCLGGSGRWVCPSTQGQASHPLGLTKPAGSAFLSLWACSIAKLCLTLVIAARQSPQSTDLQAGILECLVSSVFLCLLFL